MDNDAIKTTIEHFKEEGKTIRVRDIAYTLLSKMFADSKTAYQCLFTNVDEYDDYIQDDMRDKIESYMTEQGYIRSFSTDADTGGISFEENKREMEKMLVDIQRDMERGLIEKKDGYARMTDIRTKLNDKFKVEAKHQERTIIVEKKYNHICDRFHVECYLPTVEDLKEMYNLTEKQ